MVVSATNTGPVKFVNTAFWGPCDSVARLYGSGTVSFTSCEFVQWDDKYHRGSPAIAAYGGNLIVNVSLRLCVLCVCVCDVRVV